MSVPSVREKLIGDRVGSSNLDDMVASYLVVLPERGGFIELRVRRRRNTGTARLTGNPTELREGREGGRGQDGRCRQSLVLGSSAARNTRKKEERRRNLSLHQGPRCREKYMPVPRGTDRPLAQGEESTRLHREDAAGRVCFYWQRPETTRRDKRASAAITRAFLHPKPA